MNEITFIIKTFERFNCVKRLVKSIFKYYPDAKILIADDSEKSCKDFFVEYYPKKEIEVFELEKDCGLSYGRNYLLNKVETKYFVVLDDDFVFDKKTDILSAKRILVDNKLDIVGGFFRNYRIVNKRTDKVIVFFQSVLRYEKASNYIGTLDFDDEKGVLYAHYFLNKFPEYCLTDITHNLFVAKTEKVKNENMWDDDLKLHEHTAFFFSAKNNNFKIGFTNTLSVQHKPVRLKKYSSFRDRNFVKVFMKKNNINEIISRYDDDTPIVIKL